MIYTSWNRQITIKRTGGLFVLFKTKLYSINLHIYIYTIILINLPCCSIFACVDWIGIGSDNGLSPVRRQAITWTNTDSLSIEPLETNFSEFWPKIWQFHSYKSIWKYRQMARQWA